MIVIWLEPFGGQSPTVEGGVQFRQPRVFEEIIGAPTLVNFGKLRNHTQNICVYMRSVVLVEVGLYVVGVEQDQEQQLLILVFLEQ